MTAYRFLPEESKAEEISFHIQILEGFFEHVRVKLFDFNFSNLDVDGTCSYDFEYGCADPEKVHIYFEDFTKVLDEIVNSILRDAIESHVEQSESRDDSY